MHIFRLLILVVCFSLEANTILAATKKTIPDYLQLLHFQVNGVEFSMQRIEGGVFVMGGTREQHNEKISTDLPTHTIVLDAFYMAQTEVTQSLWKAVMPEWEFVENIYLPNFPMNYVSWDDCNEFVRRLDSITGMPFRLPTEAEWEFAARGGNKSKGYRFAGGNKIDSISWGFRNSDYRSHEVGKKTPNELRLYDMTGNMSEWCADWYAPYYLGTEPNPRGPIEGERKIVRGSSYTNCEENSYISRRETELPTEATNYIGFRLALTLPNEPTTQIVEEPALVKKIKLQNNRVKMIYVAGENPYYISETPITLKIWNKVMNIPMAELGGYPITDKTNNEWNQFIEQARKQSNQALVFASEEQIQQAITEKLIDTPKLKNKKHHWEKDTRSIQRHRRVAEKAQKWADLVGVKIATIDDPTLQIFNNKNKEQIRWLVIPVTGSK